MPTQITARSDGDLANVANRLLYGMPRNYLSGSPHLLHRPLRTKLASLAADAYDRVSQYTSEPTVLDLGAGEGSVTSMFLELGARVTAIDTSTTQLAKLRERCAEFGERVEIIVGDVQEVVPKLDRSFSIVSAISFLHHVPDYISLLRLSLQHLAPYGEVITYQDPLRIDRLSRFNRWFSAVAYVCWRCTQGDVIGGMKRTIRRRRGVYMPDCPEDFGEYHAVRNGVDQDEVLRLLREFGLNPELITYYSTQSRAWQPVGRALHVHNHFGVVARRPAPESGTQSHPAPE